MQSAKWWCKGAGARVNPSFKPWPLSIYMHKINIMHKLEFKPTRRTLLGVPAVLALWGSSALAQQTFPRSLVKLIVPFTPGGPTDLVARQLATRLQAKWGQAVVLDYKPGAGTAIGVDAVAKASADGYTLGLVNTSFVVNPLLHKRVPYDTFIDIAPITQVARLELAMVARPDAPFGTVQELLDHTKRHPGQLTYATAGAGSTAHLGVELLKREKGIDLLHVPMKGSAPAYTELMSGRLDLLVDPLFAVLPYVKSERMKAIATFGERRARGHEQFPTVGETVPGFSVGAMLGLITRAGTTASVIDRIHADVSSILKDAEVRSRMEEQGMTIVGSSPRSFGEFIASETVRWRQVIASAGIQPE